MPGPSRSLLAFRQLDWAPDSDFPELVAEAINPLRRSLARESALRLSDGLFTPFLRHRRGSGPPIIRAVPLAAAGAGEQSLDHGETILALKDAGRDRCDAGACAGSRSGRARGGRNRALCDEGISSGRLARIGARGWPLARALSPAAPAGQRLGWLISRERLRS